MSQCSTPEGRRTRFDRQKRSAKLREPADLYESPFCREAAAQSPEAYYPAVNAATLRLLASDREPTAKLARETVASMEWSRWQHTPFCVIDNLQEKFVTSRNNGILPSINEFAPPYQSKNNGIYRACENGELSSLPRLKPRQERVGLILIPRGETQVEQR
jgi:hypothetical protein